MADIETFRRETAAWLEKNCPASMRTPGGEEEAVWGGRNATYTNPDSKLWLDRMAEKGWTTPRWPPPMTFQEAANHPIDRSGEADAS